MSSILGLILLLVIFLGYGLFFRKLMKIEFSHALIFSFSSILSVYLVAAVFNFLNTAIYLSFIIGFCFFIYVIQDFFKKYPLKDIFKLITPDTLIFIIIVIAYFVWARKLPTYSFWDEYSLWGIIPKELNFYQGLRFDPNQPSSIWAPFARYVQLSSIFQYSISKLIGFKPAHNIFANCFMNVIFISAMLMERRVIWSLILPLIAIFSTLGPAIISLNSVYLDGTVGVAFAAVIALYIQSQRYNNPRLSLILIIPLLFILPNIKEVGYWLSYSAILFILFEKLISFNYRYIFIVVSLGLLPLLSKLLWGFYLKTIEVSFPPLSQVPFSSIFNIMAAIGEGKASMIKLIILQLLPYFYSSTMLITYKIAIGSMIFLMIYDKKALKPLCCFMAVSLFLFCLYMLFRVDLYLTNFSAYEAKQVAAYERYLDTYIIMFSFGILSFVKNAIQKINLQQTRKFIYPILQVNFFSKDNDHTKVILNWKKYLFRTYNAQFVLLTENLVKNLRSSKFYLLLFYLFFFIACLFTSIKSYHVLAVTLRSNKPHYKDLLARQKMFEEIRSKATDKDSIDFKDWALQDCYIYNYMESPYGMNNLNKCLKEIKQ